MIKLHQIWDPDYNVIGARAAHRVTNQSGEVQESFLCTDVIFFSFVEASPMHINSGTGPLVQD
jgi:hypothetical protein